MYLKNINLTRKITKNYSKLKLKRSEEEKERLEKRMISSLKIKNF